MNNINEARKRLAQAEDEIRKDQDRQSATMNIDELIERWEEYKCYMSDNGFKTLDEEAEIIAANAISIILQQQERIASLEAALANDPKAWAALQLAGRQRDAALAWMNSRFAEDQTEVERIRKMK